METNDREYFATRAAVERYLSQTSSDPAIAAIHADLADRYDQLVAAPKLMRPRLRVVTP